MILGQIKYFRRIFFYIVLLLYKNIASILYSISPSNERADGMLKLNSEIISSQLLRISLKRLGRVA